MPRVEIIPRGWFESPYHKRGDGTPTVDVCRDCAYDLEDGETIRDADLAKQLDAAVGDTIGSVDCGAPPYSDDEYRCNMCGELLEDDDN